MTAIAPPRWRITKHAMHRIIEMKVSIQAVLHVLAEPEVDYAQPRFGEGMRCAKRGPISVAYNEIDADIVTVLWNTQEQYTREH